MRAVVDLIVEDGFANLAMDRVAQRAGVSKAALYRRWPNKLALATDAIHNYAQDKVPAPDTGSLRKDVSDYLHAVLDSKRTDVEITQALHAALVADEDLARSCRKVLATHLSENFQTIVGRGLARGELPPGTDGPLYADVVPALIRYHRDTTGEPIDAAFIHRILDQFFPSRHR